MLYKEWLGVRLKFYMLLVLYGLAGVTVIYMWLPFRYAIPMVRNLPLYPFQPTFVQPLFRNWLTFSLLSIIPIAVVCGVDTVADETDKGTLSFLLTRAVKRSRIYTAKIVLNITALVVAYISTSGIVLLIDHLHPKYFYTEGNSNPVFLLESVRLGDALGSTLVVLLAGTTITVLTSLASIFARSTMHSLLLTVIVLLAGAVLFNHLIADIFYNSSARPLASNLPDIMWFLVLTLGLYAVGLFCFERREF